MTVKHKTQYTDADLDALTRSFQAEGPDEYPEGYYQALAQAQLLKQRRVTPEDAPNGTVVAFPNGWSATKQKPGYWTYNHGSHRPVNYDDLHKAAFLVFNPEEHR